MNFDRVRSLIGEAAERGVVLSVEGDRLRYSAPAGSLSDNLRGALRNSRLEVIAELSQPKFGARTGKHERLQLPSCFDDFWRETRASQSMASSTHVILKLDGKLTLEQMQTALQSVTSRHDLLTARFVMSAGPPSLLLEAADAPAIEVLDLSGDSAGSAARVREVIERTVWAEFADDPVFRVCLIQTAVTEFIFAFVLHHIVADFRSCEVIASEFLRMLLAPQDMSPPSNLKPIQYADYLFGLNEWLSGPAPLYRISFWKERMRAAPRVRLLPDYDPPLSPRACIELVPFIIPPDLRTRIANTASNCQATLFAAVLAAQFATLWTRLRQNDLVMAVVVSGRDDPILGDLVGNTIDCVPVRTSVLPDMTLAALTTQVHEAHRIACGYHIPRTMLVESLREIDSCFAAPLFNFVVGNTPTAAELGGIRVQPINHPAPQEMAGADWKGYELQMYDTGKQIHGIIKYMPNSYRKETLDSFLSSLLGWLEAFADRPRCTLADLT
jgi:nonribosomal peptide synthetase protein BlmVII